MNNEETMRVNSHNSLISHKDNQVKPIRDSAYYGLAGDIVRIIEPHTEADPVALLIQQLSAFGNVIGKSPNFKAEADKHSLKINPIMVGPTSKARKGTSWSQIRRIFQSVDEDWAKERIVSGLSSGEGLISALANEKNDKRLMIVETEFASTLKVMKRDGNILSAIIRQAWDAENLNNMTKNNPLRAIGTHVSIIGHITIEELTKHLTETEMANGFGNRFLWIYVRRSQILPEGGQLYSVDFQPIVMRLRDTVKYAHSVDEIKLSDDAREIWYEIYYELSEGKPGLIGALTARAEAYVMRFACLYALLDCSSVIGRNHLLAALAVWDYNDACVQYIFGDKIGDNVADTIMVGLRALPDGLTKTDISELFARHKSSLELNRALNMLLECGKVSVERIKSDGRPYEIWTAVAK